MRHGNLHRVVAMLDRRVCKAVTFGAKHDGELRLFLQTRVREGKRVVAQRHGGRLKAETVQRILPRNVFGQIRPRHLKYRAHAHAARAAIQRVAAGGGQQNRVHAERRRTAEDCADVRGVHHIFEYGNSARVCANFRNTFQSRAAHRTQHAAGQLKARQLC